MIFQNFCQIQKMQQLIHTHPKRRETKNNDDDVEEVAEEHVGINVICDSTFWVDQLVEKVCHNFGVWSKQKKKIRSHNFNNRKFREKEWKMSLLE